MFPKVSILIVHYHGLKNTTDCLDSCLKINYPNYEIFILDNDPKENAFSQLKEKYQNYPLLKFFQSDKNLGFSEGNNFLIREALKNSQTQYILCLNNDTTVKPDFLQLLVKKAQEGFAMVNAEVRQMAEPELIDNLGIETMQSMLCFNLKNKNGAIFCPSGCAVLYSRQLLENIALNAPESPKNAPKNREKEYFDKDYFLYAEDFDLGFRGLLKGFRPALAEGAVVFHQGSAGTSKMGDFAVYHSYRNIVWTITKNLPTPLFFRFLPKIFIGHLAIIFLNIVRGQGETILKAYFDAFKSLPKFLKKREDIQKNKKISNQELLKYISRGVFSEDYW